MARVGDYVLGVRCPIELVTRRKLERRSGKEWALYVAGLNQKKIIWQPSWQQRSKITFSCAGFPNVPLIGVRGCINYNPVLAQRQFGYPIRGAPTAAALVVLVCYYRDGFVTKTLHRIRNAWKDLFYAERDTRLWSVNKGVPYQQWLADRVRKVKLPYHSIPQKPLGESVPEEPAFDMRSEEIQKLKEETEWLKRKNDVLKDDIQSLQHDYLNVKVECEAKTKANESLMKRQRVDRQCIMEMTQKLTEAESTSRVREWEGDTSSEYQWKRAYEEASWDKQKLTRELYDLQTKFDNIEARMKDIVAKYEEKIKSE